MADFNFTTDDDDSSSESEQSTMFTFTDGNTVTKPSEVTVELTDEQMEYVEELARKRAQSYIDGRTGDDAIGDHTSTSVHVEGLKGELAVSIAYGDGTVDESISAKGDDGIDVSFEAGGETFDADVKVAQYTPTWIMKKTGAMDYADAYVACHSEKGSNTVTIKGWATRDELCKDSNVEPSPAGGDWDNYVLRHYRNPPSVEVGEQVSAE